MFGMGTGVAPSLWPPVFNITKYKPFKPKQLPKVFYRYEEVDLIKELRVGITEKFEHSIVIDVLQIGVYLYFGWNAYNNLGYGQNDVLAISANPSIIAVQLAGLLVVINALELLHDKFRGSSDPLH